MCLLPKAKSISRQICERPDRAPGADLRIRRGIQAHNWAPICFSTQCCDLRAFKDEVVWEVDFCSKLRA